MFFFGDYRKFFFFFYCISAISLFSQVPNGINYQTKLRASSGYVLANKTVDLQFEIININNNLSVYKEIHKSNTDQFGLVDMVIGNGNAISGSFGSITFLLDWLGSLAISSESFCILSRKRSFSKHPSVSIAT